MNSRGFTVVELLIAAGILSIVIAGLTVVLVQQQRQFSMTREAVDLDQTARATLDYVASQIRNAVSRQGKTFSLRFVNGGSPGCANNTNNPGTQNSPPDCLTVYTWDITRGQDGDDLPSIVGTVTVVSQGPPLVLQLPQEWFPPLVDSALIEDGDFLGFRSRINLCNPADPAICGTNPVRCTECATALRVTNINALNQAEINSTADILEQNFQENAFTDMTQFINNPDTSIPSFIPSIASQVSEMTIVQAQAFRIDTANRELEMSQNGGNFQPVSGGNDAPGIVDLQLVFNLQGTDGGITKVGVPLNAANRMFPDFTQLAAQGNPALGTVKDIRTVEIYLVVRSRIKPQLISGQRVPIQAVPQVGDVLQRNTDHASFGPTVNGEPQGVGFVYRVFSTTVYIRNMTREEFG